MATAATRIDCPGGPDPSALYLTWPGAGFDEWTLSVRREDEGVIFGLTRYGRDDEEVAWAVRADTTHTVIALGKFLHSVAALDLLWDSVIVEPSLRERSALEHAEQEVALLERRAAAAREAINLARSIG